MWGKPGRSFGSKLLENSSPIKDKELPKQEFYLLPGLAAPGQTLGLPIQGSKSLEDSQWHPLRFCGPRVAAALNLRPASSEGPPAPMAGGTGPQSLADRQSLMEAPDDSSGAQVPFTQLIHPPVPSPPPSPVTPHPCQGQKRNRSASVHA